MAERTRATGAEATASAGRRRQGGSASGALGVFAAVFRILWAATRRLIGAVDSVLWLLVRFIRALIIGGVAAGSCAGVVVLVATWEVSLSLPADSETLMDGRENGSVVVLDNQGQLLGARGQRFSAITIREAGPVLVDAILATEDRRFYWHVGVDPIGLTRAILVNLQSGRHAQGGSSITQQVAKLAFLTSERTLARKMRELPLSLALEWRYSKDQILEIYLNRVYLGAGAYGFNAAAQFYFNKKPLELSYAEAALLAGLLRAPSRWSPLSDFEAAQSRAGVILDAMLDAERISTIDHRAAHDQIAFLRPPKIDEYASYFVDWAAEQVPSSFWRRSSDLILVTTLDRAAQAAAEDAVARVFRHGLPLSERNAQASVTVLARDGAVVAMVGGRDYAASQFNRATLARRQLGSAFKPIVFAAALQTGLNAYSKVKDSPITIGNWTPKNYSHSYRGWIPLSTALAKSSNVAAVRLAQHAGVQNVVAMSRRLGFAAEVPAVPSLALGTLETNTLEVASAYNVFANDGVVRPAFGIREIRDSEGGLLWSRTPPPRMQAISPHEADQMRIMMRAVVETGTARNAQLETTIVAGKTGTTQDYRDAWFAGYSERYVAAVWMGNDNFERMGRVTGGSYPAEIFRETVAALHGEPQKFGVEGGPSSPVGSVGDGYASDRQAEPTRTEEERRAVLAAQAQERAMQKIRARRAASLREEAASPSAAAGRPTRVIVRRRAEQRLTERRRRVTRRTRPSAAERRRSARSWSQRLER